MDPRKNYYETLGVQESASGEEIRKAFRRLARKHHPDVNPGDKAAESKFKEINEAHSVLCDRKRREEYDAIRRGAFAGAPGAGGHQGWRGGAGGFDPGDLLFGGARGVDFGDVIGDLLRGGRGGFAPGGARGQDVSAELAVDFLDMARGTVREVEYRSPAACAACGGTGRSGRKGCTHCNGTGSILSAGRIKVRIPAGARDGSRIRVPGKGEDGGDLVILLRMVPHPYFRREGNDVYVDLPLNYSEAVKGAKVTVPTIDGPVKVTVPPGSSSGQNLRLKGKGIPDPGGAGRGNQYVVLQVAVPKTRSEDFLDIVDRLSDFEDPNLRGGWN